MSSSNRFLSRSLSIAHVLLVIAGLLTLGGMRDQSEVTLWIGKAVQMRVALYGPTEGALTAFGYLGFYYLPFLLTYWLARSVTYGAFESRDRVGSPVHRREFKNAAVAFALAGGLTTLALLNPLVEMLRAVQVQLDDISNHFGDVAHVGLVATGAAVLFLCWMGIFMVRNAAAKVRVVVPFDREIHCLCPSCGNEYRFPATDLVERNIVFARQSP